MRSAWVLVVVAACGSSKERGDIGELCYPNGTCNADLVCFQDSCVALDGGVTLIDAQPTDAPGGFVCADDSTLEPNNTVQTAFVTPVDTQNQQFNIAGMAICPAGDKDHYSVVLSTANKGIEVTIVYDAGPALQLSLLNAGGTSIANGAATANPNELRACVSNLPSGTYYASVFGGATTKNNYRLSLKTVAACN